jgi:hypothetical protein
MLTAWRDVLRVAAARDAIPVLVLPELTRSQRQVAEREGVNWVDFAGNARIEEPSLLVRLEGRRARVPRTRSGVNPFAERSLNLVRVLLVEPKRRWRQRELVTASGLSQSRASKVLTALDGLGLIRRSDDGALDVPHPEELLDAWADDYSYARQTIVPVHLTGDGMMLARTLSERLDDVDVIHWFTGLPAAWAYDQFARFRLVSVYVDADPALVAEHLGLRYAERGANIHLTAARDQRLEIGHSVVDRLRCVHTSQVYVDLLGLPERAAEAAEHLRPKDLHRGRRVSTKPQTAAG